MRVHRVAALLVTFGVLLPTTLLAGDSAPGIVGKWQLDAARSVDKIPTADKQTITGVQVGVAGMPVPTPSAAQSPVIGSPRDPDVMQAQEFVVEMIDGTLHLRFAGGREVELTPGSKQGVKTKWSDKRLTTSYQTTRRTVSQDYRLTAPDELTVVVKIDPKDEKARTYTRVFKRSAT